jgi:hypothetical protein
MAARIFYVLVSILSNTLARQELGWTPQVSLRNGIARTAKRLILPCNYNDTFARKITSEDIAQLFCFASS